MKDASLDTNALLRWLIGDISSQAGAVDKLLVRDRTFQVADMAVQEVVYVLEKGGGMPRKSIADNLQTLMAQSNINCNRKLFKQVLPLYIQHPGLSFVDCCLAVYAALNDAPPLYTFDKALAKKLPKLVRTV